VLDEGGAADEDGAGDELGEALGFDAALRIPFLQRTQRNIPHRLDGDGGRDEPPVDQPLFKRTRPPRHCRQSSASATAGMPRCLPASPAATRSSCFPSEQATPRKPSDQIRASWRRASTFNVAKKIRVERLWPRRYPRHMSNDVASIEHAVEQLGRNDLAVFREWFSTFEAAEWDAQIERDICAGKLDALAEEGIREYETGETRSL